MPQIFSATTRLSHHHGSAWETWERVWTSVDVPQPSPDIVPLPPSPHPIPPSPVLPPEINEPTLPGQNEPVREPGLPAPWSMNGVKQNLLRH